MGLCNSPDIFQERMNKLLNGLEYARTDIGILLTIVRSLLNITSINEITYYTNEKNNV